MVFPMFAEEAAKAAGVTGIDVIMTVPGEFELSWPGTEPTERVADRTADDTAVILYTSGHHRPAQGRRAHPRQPRAAMSAPRSRR